MHGCSLSLYVCYNLYVHFCGLYYKPMMIVNEGSKVVTMLETSLTEDARVIIYDRHMFILQATVFLCFSLCIHKQDLSLSTIMHHIF